MGLQSEQNAPAVPTGLPNGTAALENSLLKLDIPLPEDPTGPLLGVCPRRVKADVHTEV